MITGISEKGDISETSLKKVKEFILNQNNIGVDVWLKNKSNLFWSFVHQEKYFFHNFDFNFLPDYDRTEQEVSPLFIKLALSELHRTNKCFLGFALDQFGSTEWHSFEDIFNSEDQNILEYDYIPDIIILRKIMMNRIAINSNSKIFSINESFDCTIKDVRLADLWKTLVHPKN